MLNSHPSFGKRNTRVTHHKPLPSLATLHRRARGLQDLLVEQHQLAAASAARNLVDDLRTLADTATPARRPYFAATAVEVQEVCETGLDAILNDFDGIADIAPDRIATGISNERAAGLARRLHEAAAYLEEAAQHIADRAVLA